MSDVVERRVRGGGGSARRAERTAISFETAKFIQRNIPNFEILNEEALQIIEWNAETILEEIGVNFVDNPEALLRWKSVGADIVGERVRIPRGLARKLCSTAPKTFTQHARNSERNVEIGGRNLVLAPVYGPPFVRDAEGGRRYATISDFQKFVKLGYMSKWLHHSGGYVARAYDAVGQALYGVGHRTFARRRFGGDVQNPVWR
jgi:trimethylamine--corrinoid protein Co-methyltransferase